MTTDPDLDGDADCWVTVSLSVFGAGRIERLEDYLQESAGPTDEHRYHLGTTTFNEPSWDRRAETLATTINDLLDRLASIPPDVLHAPTAFVRLFLTLPSGAETIDAKTLKRLAEVNATVWIDA